MPADDLNRPVGASGAGDLSRPAGIPAAKPSMSLKHQIIIAAVASVLAVGIIGGLVWTLAGEDEDLRTPSWDSHCNWAELYEVQLAVAGVSGRNLGGAVQGSVPGCKPVCVLTYPTLSDPTDLALSEMELADLSNYELTLNNSLPRSKLPTLTEAEARMLATSYPAPLKTLAALGEKLSGKSVLFENPTKVYMEADDGIVGVEFTAVLLSYRIAGQMPPVGVRVAPSGKQCNVYDVTGKTVAVGAAAGEEGGIVLPVLIMVVTLLLVVQVAVTVCGFIVVRSRQEAEASEDPAATAHTEMAARRKFQVTLPNWLKESSMARKILVAAVALAALAIGVGVATAVLTGNEPKDESGIIVDDFPCDRVEIYDAKLASAQVYGSNLEGAVQGFYPGCIPVCVFTYPTLSDPTNVAASGAELADLSNYELTLNKNLPRSELLTLTEAEAEMLEVDAVDPAKGPVTALAALGAKVSGKSVLFDTPTSVYFGVGAGMVVGDTADSMARYGGIAGVRVAPNGKQCNAYYANGAVAADRSLLVVPAGGRIAAVGVVEQSVVEQGAAEEDGVAPQTLIAVAALVALALAAVAVRGVRAQHSKAQSDPQEQPSGDISRPAGIPAVKAPMSLKHQIIIAAAVSVVAVGIIGGLVWALAGAEEEPHPPLGFDRPPCNVAELYNVKWAAAGLFRMNLEGAVQGSAPGCIPACVLKYPTLSDPGDVALSAMELADSSRYELTLNENLSRSELLTVTEAEAEVSWLSQDLAAIGPKVSGKSVLFETPASVFYGVDTGVAVGDILNALVQHNRIVGVRVAPDASRCEAYNATGKIVTDAFLLVPAGERIADEGTAEQGIAEQGIAEQGGAAQPACRSGSVLVC